MPRKRQFVSNAARQKAYRVRRKLALKKARAETNKRKSRLFCLVEGCPGLAQAYVQICEYHQPLLPFEFDAEQATQRVH